MRYLTITLAALTLAACVPNKSYRKGPQSLLTEEVKAPPTGLSYTLGFIEFDDWGELFEPEQADRLVSKIAQIKKGGAGVTVVVFVHGWKNNASDQSGHVWGFREELADIQRAFPERPLVGVYVGWRGAVVSAPVLKEFTFWDRQAKAINIPGAHMTASLLRIMRAAKGPKFSDPDSVCLLVGHSFGGQVLERAITQTLVNVVFSGEQDDTGPKELDPPADLVVFVNESAPALEAKQLLDLLHRRGAELTIREQQHPLVVSLTSTGDFVTKFALPGGQFVTRPFHSLRQYDEKGDFLGTKAQSAYYYQSTANLQSPQSHSIAVHTEAGDDKLRYTSVCLPGETVPYDIVRTDSRNDTPYWVMQMPTRIVPDHSDIFRKEFRLLLEAFIERRYASAPPEAGKCPQALTQVRAVQRSSSMKSRMSIK